jgi:chromosome segregation ATPase
MNSLHIKLAPVYVALAVVAAGCSSGVSELTKDRVSRSEVAVQQAQQAIGNSEVGAVELQAARDDLDRAHQALAAKKDEPAQRYAQRAQLDSDLAIAKSQSAAARKAADELSASIQTLKQETQRGVNRGNETPTSTASDTTTPPNQ